MNKQQEFLTEYDRCHERFAKFCHALTGDSETAKDLMSESILKAFEHFDKLKDKKAFASYIITIARRIYLNQLRRNKFWGVFSHTKAQQTQDESSQSDSSIKVRILYEALEMLPVKQKEALILFEISGFTLKEVAEIQNSGLSAVKARLARGRKKLTLLLSDAESAKHHIYETAIV